jgi:hypothetical protein
LLAVHWVIPLLLGLRIVAASGLGHRINWSEPATRSAGRLRRSHRRGLRLRPKQEELPTPPALPPAPVRAGLPALGKELFQLLDPLILRHEGCLLLSLSKYEESKPPVALHLMGQHVFSAVG